MKLYNSLHKYEVSKGSEKYFWSFNLVQEILNQSYLTISRTRKSLCTWSKIVILYNYFVRINSLPISTTTLNG